MRNIRQFYENVKELYERNFEPESYFKKVERDELFKGLKEEREKIKKIALLLSASTTGLGIIQRAFGIPFRYYYPPLDFTVNVALGYLGAYLVTKAYNHLRKKENIEKDSIAISIGSVSILSALKEGIDASAHIKSLLPNFLRRFFNTHNLADPVDFLGNTLGATLFILVDKAIDKYYDNLEEKYTNLYNRN